MTITITAVRASDLPTMFTLLKQCHLPTEGLASHLATTLVARFKREVARAEADPVLHQSIEWTSACPVTAQVMVLTL